MRIRGEDEDGLADQDQGHAAQDLSIEDMSRQTGQDVRPASATHGHEARGLLGQRNGRQNRDARIGSLEQRRVTCRAMQEIRRLKLGRGRSWAGIRRPILLVRALEKRRSIWALMRE
ncbi:hypothetical protein VNO78_31370 [Psophocarpus tetragonolobus]|uniref:Uncharacterized protein n=1 Tax=Psophocarpus tetragonolobus TaxID=3891 RepID=A0AAN9RYH2_PSOTE